MASAHRLSRFAILTDRTRWIVHTRMRAPDVDSARAAEAAAAAFSRRDFAAASLHAQALLQCWPDDVRGHLVLGLIAVEHGKLDEARWRFEKVKPSPPPAAAALNAFGAGLAQLGDVAGARTVFARAGESGSLDAWRNLASLENGLRNWNACIAANQRLIQAAPGDAGAYAMLAHIYERRHDLERAKEHASHAIEGDPLNAVARVALARALLQQDDFAGAEAAALPVAQSERASDHDRSVAWGVVGDARDRLDDASGAFAAFTAANQLTLRNSRTLLGDMESAHHPTNVRRLTDLAANAKVATWRWPNDLQTPAPVFLVGFPRSGTTLLDQIVSSHSRIVCLEERQYLSAALTKTLGSARNIDRYETLSNDEIVRTRSFYWELVRAEIGETDKLVIDKLPLNIVILPLIKRIFPDAKIIFALRDPRDVTLSCYQQRFGMNAATVQFLQLDTTAAYYDIAMRLAEISQQTLSLDLQEVRYEDVVSDLASAASALSRFLGVSYEPAMLDYRTTALTRDIDTPSIRQVIQPLYTRSIGRWRRYEQQLATVIPTLNPWAARFGYQP